MRLSRRVGRSGRVDEEQEKRQGGDGRVAGWSAMAGTHDFVVADEAVARALAGRLAEYGFPGFSPVRIRMVAGW
ncbi:hypothetical protein ACFQYP_50085 [Nonomuraea antimicrobica]